MWLIQVSCSDPVCTEEFEVVVDDLAEVERVVCACGHSVVVLAVSHFEPSYLAAA
jgi:hypothetical protein